MGGPTEWIIIGVLVLVLFGVGRLSGVGKALGQSIREFRQETRKPIDEGEQEAGSASSSGKDSTEDKS